MVASFTLLRFLVCNSLRFFEVHDTWSFYVTASILVLSWTFFIFIWILMSFIGFVCIVANGNWVCNNNKYSFMLHGALNWPSSPPVPKRRRFFSSDAVRCLVLSLFTELLDPVWPNVWPNSILCLMVSAEKPFILWIFKPIETKWLPFSENASKKIKIKKQMLLLRSLTRITESFCFTQPAASFKNWWRLWMKLLTFENPSIQLVTKRKRRTQVWISVSHKDDCQLICAEI